MLTYNRGSLCLWWRPRRLPPAASGARSSASPRSAATPGPSTHGAPEDATRSLRAAASAGKSRVILKQNLTDINKIPVGSPGTASGRRCRPTPTPWTGPSPPRPRAPNASPGRSCPRSRDRRFSLTPGSPEVSLFLPLCPPLALFFWFDTQSCAAQC